MGFAGGKGPRVQLLLAATAIALLAWPIPEALAVNPDPPTNPLVEGQDSPQQILTRNPTFSWTFNDQDPDDYQTQLRVILNTRYAEVPLGQRGVPSNLDTGWITSGESVYTYGVQMRSLTTGRNYYWQVQTRDKDGGFGLWSEVKSFTINIPPTLSSPYTDGGYAPKGIVGPQPQLSWVFHDGDPNDTQGAYRMLVASTTENRDAEIGDMWDSGKVLSDEFTIDYAGAYLEPGIKYYWTVNVWDNLDSESGFPGGTFFVMDTPPLAPQNPMVEGAANPQIIYDATPDFSWVFSDADTIEDGSEMQGYYRLLVATSDELLDADSADMWDSGKVESFDQDITFGGLPLPGGDDYYWKAIVWDYYDNPGPWTDIQSFSLPVLETPSYIYDGQEQDIDYQQTIDSISANWEAVQLAVGYWYAMGTNPGGNDIADWTDNGADPAVTVTGLVLEQGRTYYTSIKAKEASGGFSGIITSDGLKIDSSGPSTVANVNDGIDDADLDWTATTSSLSANWTVAEDDESGVAAYLYAIGILPGGDDVVGWTSAGLSTVIKRMGLNLVSGQTYYFSVKVVNGAGLESDSVSSDGIEVATSPEIVSTAAATALVSRSYHYDSDDTAQADGTAPITWSLISGPDEFEIDPDSGLITWIPEDSGNITFIIGAANVVGYDEQIFTVTVNGPVIVSQPGSSAFVGLPYYYDTDNSAQAQTQGIVTWRIITAPDGFEIDPLTGLVGWTLTTLGPQTITIRAQDEYSYNDQTFTVIVRALAIEIEPGQINIVLVENLEQDDADILGDTYTFEDGDYQAIDVTQDIQGPTTIIAYPENPALIEILPGLQNSYSFDISPGWNSVPNPFEVSLTYTDFHFAFAAQGEESVPLSESEHLSGYALIWLDGEYKLIPDQLEYIPAQTGFFVYSLAHGALAISR